jgi:hypothetical protein
MAIGVGKFIRWNGRCLRRRRGGACRLLQYPAELAGARGGGAGGAMGLLPFGETRTGLYARPPRARRSLELGARVMKRRHNPDVRGMAGIRRDYTSNYWWNDFIVHPLVWDPVAGCTKHQEFREAFRMPRSMFERLLRDLGTANLIWRLK